MEKFRSVLLQLFYLSILIFFLSCTKVSVNEPSKIQTIEANRNGLVVTFLGYAQRDLFLSINDAVVFEGIAYPDSGVYYTNLEIPTNIRNLVDYKFKVIHSGSENNFQLPAQGLDSLAIGEVGLFNIEHIEKKYPNKNKEFTFYLSKNIANNCKVKIAADSVTLYDGLFLNNYPRKYYNSMKFTHTFSKKRFVEMYVEVFDNFTYFSIDTEKYDAVKVSFDNHLIITTNLDEEWNTSYID